MQIEGNAFIVTGGASGLGAATARMLVGEGGNVVIADLSEKQGNELAAELGANARFMAGEHLGWRRFMTLYCPLGCWSAARGVPPYRGA